MRARAKPWRRGWRGGLGREGFPVGFGLEAGYAGWAARLGRPFQFGNPPLQPLNHPLQLQNGGLQPHDDGDESSAVGGAPGRLRFPCLMYDTTTATRASVRKARFAQFNPPTLNSYFCLGYVLSLASVSPGRPLHLGDRDGPLPILWTPRGLVPQQSSPVRATYRQGLAQLVDLVAAASGRPDFTQRRMLRILDGLAQQRYVQPNTCPQCWPPAGICPT